MKKKDKKEEIDAEEQARIREKLVSAKKRHFKNVSDSAYSEFLQFNPCGKCKFLTEDCHKRCGIVMKWLTKEGKLKGVESFGNHNRIVSELEHDDSTGVLGDDIDGENKCPFGTEDEEEHGQFEQED